MRSRERNHQIPINSSPEQMKGVSCGPEHTLFFRRDILSVRVPEDIVDIQNNLRRVLNKDILQRCGQGI